MIYKDYLKEKGYLSIKLNYDKETIYPKKEDIFKAFRLTPYEETRVVILGQDPYHTPNCANGLAFSVPSDLIKKPPSLINIFKELESDLGIKRTNSDLSDWASQGVLLLNTSLSVLEGKPRSHFDLWVGLTRDIIDLLNKKDEPVIFVLWGNDARNNKKYIDLNKHFVIESAHPSPLSAYNGFFGSKPFSKVNKILIDNKLNPIKWG